MSVPEATDAALIERVADHERDAFEELYARYARPVLGLALRRLGDRGRAEDSVQEVFAAVWRSAVELRPVARAGWRLALHDRAQRDRRRATPAHRRRPSPIRPSSSRPARRRTRRPRRRGTPGASTGRSRPCPSNERAVIDLAYFSGFSQSEVADFLHIPLGTVKTRTRSGLARLADALEGEL